MDGWVVVGGWRGVESGYGPGVAVVGRAGGRRRGGGGSAGGPRPRSLQKKCPTCQKAHARETHGCGSGAANSGKGVGIATRDIGRWACRGKCLGGRRG